MRGCLTPCRVLVIQFVVDIRTLQSVGIFYHLPNLIDGVMAASKGKGTLSVLIGSTSSHYPEINGGGRRGGKIDTERRSVRPSPVSVSPTLIRSITTFLSRIATLTCALSPNLFPNPRCHPPFTPIDRWRLAAAPADDDDDSGGADDSWQCNIHSRIPGILRALLADSASVRRRFQP